jgi:hypothetical protein
MKEMAVRCCCRQDQEGRKAKATKRGFTQVRPRVVWPSGGGKCLFGFSSHSFWPRPDAMTNDPAYALLQLLLIIIYGKIQASHETWTKNKPSITDYEIFIKQNNQLQVSA